MAGSSWILLALLSGFLMAAVNVLDRYVLTRLVKTALAPLVVLGFIGLGPALLILAAKGRLGLNGARLLLAVGAGLIFLAMAYFYFRAAQVEEISRVVPLFYLSPALVAILARVLLDESLPGRKYVGLALLVVGTMLISSRWPPGLRRGPAFGFMLLAAAALAAYTLATKAALKFADYWTVFAVARLGMFLGIIPTFCRHRRKLQAEIAGRRGRKMVGLMAGNEALAMAGSFFFTLAASRGPISLVNALSSTQPFFVLSITLVLAHLRPGLLGEETNRWAIIIKIGAILVMFAGLFLAV